MSQEEILKVIEKNPGILQSKVIRGSGDKGFSGKSMIALVVKGCVRRKMTNKGFRVWPTGVKL